MKDNARIVYEFTSPAVGEIPPHKIRKNIRRKGYVRSAFLRA